LFAAALELGTSLSKYKLRNTSYHDGNLKLAVSPNLSKLGIKELFLHILLHT